MAVTTYQYGDGTPLSPDNIPRIADIMETVTDAHYYLDKHGLSCETGWKQYTQDVEVNRHEVSTFQDEQDYDVDDGYEP